MRKLFSVIALLGIFVGATSSCRRINQRLGMGNTHRVLISKGEYPASSIQKLIATTSGGNIDVVGDAADQAVLEVYGSYQSQDSAEIVAKIKESFDLTISHDNNALSAIAQQKRNLKEGLFNNNMGLAVHFVVHVGKNVESTLKTSGGNIRLQQLIGKQDFQTSGGNLHIENIQGNLSGETAGGNIDLSNIEGQEISLHTSGGNIKAENVNGTTHLETSGGNITLAKGKGNYILETSGGNVHADDVDGSLKMSTSGGNVEASNINGGIIGSTSGGNIHTKFTSVTSNIELDNQGGSIHIAIPKDAKVNVAIASEEVHADGLVNFSGKSDKHAIEGTLNGGGPTITAKTSGGSINLNVE